MELHPIESAPTQYTTNSVTMANEMASYHECLQRGNTTPPSHDHTSPLLAEMPHLTDHLKHKLSGPLTYREIKHALMNSPNNKATGINGIPADLLKELHRIHNQNAKTNKPSFNIVNLLRA